MAQYWWRQHCLSDRTQIKGFNVSGFQGMHC